MKIIVICGPTAVGKSDLAIKLAEHFNGEVINADSMQVYKEMDIGTAKITNDLGIKHHLIDIRNPDEDYSVYEYQKDARKKIEEIRNKGKTPILVGGTGLYIKAALYDYKFGTTQNEVDSNLSNEELYELVKAKDPHYDVHVNNRNRLISALYFDKEQDAKLLYPTIFIGLTLSREKLYERINNRVDEMMNRGLEEEVKSLDQKYPDSRALRAAIGYKEINDYEGIDKLKQNSRKYAKRQYTWFNNQLPVKWFNVTNKDYLEEIKQYIEKESN